MNRLKNFGPVYLINLKDHDKRLKNAKKEFKKYDITDYTVIDAVDGRKDDLSGIIVGKYPKLKSSEIGCLASHIKALKHWLDNSNSEYAIIMEDDFSFDTVDNWSWDWDFVVNNIPKDAEIVQFIMIQNQPIKFNMHKKEKFRDEIKMTYSWSTACYLIKRNYAKALVKEHYIDGKYKFNNYGFNNQAADVILYNLGTAYSMPIFTHTVDSKSAINLSHEGFHTKSRNHINSWWKENKKKYTKEELFDINFKINLEKENSKICFKIFHNETDDPKMRPRNILTSRAKKQLITHFNELDTPTIIMSNDEDISKFYKKAKIKIYPKGHEDNGWKPGELGIWASNYTAWTNFSKSEYDNLILMEDDIQLTKTFNESLIKYIKELPDDWDVFTVYIPDTGNIRYKKNKESLLIGKGNICKVYQSWSCLCYVVSKNGALKMIKDVKKPVSRPIDHYLFYHDELNVYSIKYGNKNICDIYRTNSTVQGSSKKDMTGIV